MTDITWGPEILVSGVRPAWLGDDVEAMDIDRRPQSRTNGDVRLASEWGWLMIDAIRLPADHFAYVAISKGYTPWGGGDAAPDDWDQGRVLLRSGATWMPGSNQGDTPDKDPVWQRGLHGDSSICDDQDCIGYRKRATEQSADMVTIARMTEAAARHYFLGRTTGTNQDRFVSLLRSLNLIREETLAERFTRETGHEVTAAVEAALAWDRPDR